MFRLPAHLHFILPIFLAAFLNACALMAPEKSVDFYRQNPDLFLFELRSMNDRLKTFVGSGHLTVETPQEQFQGLARVFYKAPDSLLVELRAGLGVSVGKLLVVGSTVQLYNIRDRVLFVSEGREVPLDDLIGMSLYSENLFEATLGLPRNKQTLDSLLSWRAVDNYIIYKQKMNATDRELTADLKEKAIVRYRIVREDEDTTICTFRQFRKSKGLRLPRHIQVMRERQKQRLSLFYSRVGVNEQLPTGMFRLIIPDGVEIIRLDGQP